MTDENLWKRDKRNENNSHGSNFEQEWSAEEKKYLM